MKRNFKISSFRINPSTITNNASFRFRVYINLINYFERVFRGVLIFVACYYIEQSSTYCRAIDDNSNSSSFFANSKWQTRDVHTFGNESLSASRSAIYDQQPNVSSSLGKLLVKYRFSLCSPRPSVSGYKVA